MNEPVRLAQGLLGAVFLGSGGAKLAGQMKGEFERFGYPPWFRIATGLVEVTSGASLLAGLRDARWAAAGSLLACGMMTGALWTHLARAGDPLVNAAPAGLLLGLSSWVAVQSGAELAPDLMQGTARRRELRGSVAERIAPPGSRSRPHSGIGSPA